VKITFAVSFTTIAGYMLSKGSFDSGLVLPTIGIFLLACGSSALNHYQDADRDKLMKRTASRPIPSGKISRTETLIFAALLSTLGSILIYVASGLLAMQLGILALIWYNGIYTPLKRKTAFAVIPGSVIGSIPPLVGWVAGGGDLFTIQALLLAFFFFIWQVPHFWLLMLKYGPEYTEAGYPSITQIYSEKSIRFMTFVWTFATAVSALMLPIFGLIANSFLIVIVLLSVVWLVFTFAGLLRKTNIFSPFFYFMRINYFVLAVILSLIIDPMLK
ncbi:MAG: protoheme IX farnesyltransferase, partial [Bacteroidales bacterium]